MVTSFDVAKLAGVSQATVSRALRGDSRVAAATRQAVEHAAEKLGYVPNIAGRALSSGKSNRIGLLITDPRNGFYHRIIAPIAEILQEQGKELVLIIDGPQVQQVHHRIQSLGLDGVVLGTTTIESTIPFYLDQQKIPFVYFNRTSPSVMGDAAVIDASAGYYKMLQEIVALGHQRIALINGPTNSTTGFGRAAALKGFLAANEITIPPHWEIDGEFSMDTGVQGLRHLWGLADKPTVVICGNDMIACGLINEAKRLGVSIPTDLSVVGFDNMEDAALPVYDLATVGYDLQKLIKHSVSLLLQRIDDPSREVKEVSVPSQFIARGSLGAPAQQETT